MQSLKKLSLVQFLVVAGQQFPWEQGEAIEICGLMRGTSSLI